jgi:hypothetical protein
MGLNIAILAWEYPPRIVGEMAYYVEKLAQELSKENDVCVITCHDAPYLYEKVSNSLEIYRVQNPVQPHVNVVTWALSLSSEIQRIVADIYYDKSRKFDIIDGHEWQFVTAATALKRAFGIPFVLTFHSLESKRSSDPSAPLSLCIKGLERVGAYESNKIITRSKLLKSEVESVHQVPPSNVRYIPESGSWLRETLDTYNQVITRQ